MSKSRTCRVSIAESNRLVRCICERVLVRIKMWKLPLASTYLVTEWLMPLREHSTPQVTNRSLYARIKLVTPVVHPPWIQESSEFVVHNFRSRRGPGRTWLADLPPRPMRDPLRDPPRRFGKVKYETMWDGMLFRRAATSLSYWGSIMFLGRMLNQPTLPKAWHSISSDSIILL